MAPTKRKADAVDKGTDHTQQRKRSSAPSATAAVDRPRRARASGPASTPVTTETFVKKKPTTKNKEETSKSQKPIKANEGVESDHGSKQKEALKAKKEANAEVTSKSKSKVKQSESNSASKNATTEDRVPGQSYYWLMKAEPESRIERGVDVKFSIQDLEKKKEPEAWDGVRNHMAQKNMRTMRKGDLAFFYHSNCKIPGIAGVMRIVREHSIDESAFDESHPYYDPKSSRDKPRWRVVHVEHVLTFDKFIPLKELQKHATQGGPLADMQVLRMSRLSVSGVSASEWEFIVTELEGMDMKKLDSK